MICNTILFFLTVLSVSGSAEMNITSVVYVVEHHVHLLTVSMQRLEKKMV
jgi:hypothetical protein